MEPDQKILKDRLNNKVKISIIILTIVTLCAFGALLIKVAYSVNSPENKIDRYQYLRSIGDKLKNNGLNEQAIDQYIKYLNKSKTDALTRSTVAHNVGELYMGLSNCEEALVWLFHAETAGSTYQRADELKQHIDICLIQKNPQEPKNLMEKLQLTLREKTLMKN